MEFAQFTAFVSDFFQTHLLIGIAALAIVVYFVYQNPKESFKVVVILGVLAIAFYLVTQLGSSTDTGVSTKEELYNKSKRAIDE